MATTKVKETQVKNESLTNSQVSPSAGLEYSKLNLTNGIVNADINSSAGITYGKLNLTSSITNNDLSSGARQGVLQSKTIMYFDEVFNFSASSSFNDVNTVVTGIASTDTPTTLPSTKGVFVAQSYNIVQLRGNVGRDPIDDGFGNQVFGRMSFKDVDSQPSNITGVTVAWVAQGIANDDLDYVDATTELSFGGGSAVDVSAGGLFVLYDSGGVDFIVVDVVFGSLPASDQTDALTFSDTGYYLGYFSIQSGNEVPYEFTAPTAIDFLFVEVYDLYNAPPSASLTGVGQFVDIAGLPLTGASVSIDSSGMDNSNGTNAQDVLDDIDGAIGDRSYTEDNVITDNESVADSLDALDIAFGELYDTGSGTEGVGVVGDRAARYSNITPVADTLEATLDAIDTAIGGSSAPGTYAEEERTGSTSSTWVLSNVPNASLGHIHIFLNGQKLFPGAGNDFTITTDTVTFNVGIEATDRTVANYVY